MSNIPSTSTFESIMWAEPAAAISTTATPSVSTISPMLVDTSAVGSAVASRLHTFFGEGFPGTSSSSNLSLIPIIAADSVVTDHLVDSFGGFADEFGQEHRQQYQYLQYRPLLNNVDPLLSSQNVCFSPLGGDRSEETVRREDYNALQNNNSNVYTFSPHQNTRSPSTESAISFTYNPQSEQQQQQNEPEFDQKDQELKIKEEESDSNDDEEEDAQAFKKFKKMKAEVSGQAGPKRKRQRLDHLTAEEKLQRRKLKNRLAAQSARDRKKARLTELEAQVEHLMEEKTKVEARCTAAEMRVATLEAQLAQAQSAITKANGNVCSMCDQKKTGSKFG